MKRMQSIAAPAVLMLWCLVPAHATPKIKNETPPQSIFEQIDALSAEVADTADSLADMARRQRDPRAHLEGLDVLRADINRIGSELQTLEAERSSLSPWEDKALDRILPLMHDAAENAEKAIQAYTSDEARLWASSYVDDTARIFKDSDEVATLVRDYLKLAKTREKERRMEQSLGDVAGS